MPHIILEHNIKNQEVVLGLCKKLHKTLAEQETIRLEAIKTRAHYYENIILGGEGGEEKKYFAHVNLKLLPGRSAELKDIVSKRLHSVLLESLVEGAFSVELSELQSYSKN